MNFFEGEREEKYRAAKTQMSTAYIFLCYYLIGIQNVTEHSPLAVYLLVV